MGGTLTGSEAGSELLVERGEAPVESDPLRAYTGDQKTDARAERVAFSPGHWSIDPRRHGSAALGRTMTRSSSKRASG
jgi:hypothetical protein